MRETLPEARLLIVGDGPDRPRIEALVAGLWLGEHVTLAGMREDVPEILAASDLLVHATAGWEGMPLSILEAMAAGLPVVASGRPGIAEAVARQTDASCGLPPPGAPCARPFDSATRGDGRPRPRTRRRALFAATDARRRQRVRGGGGHKTMGRMRLACASYTSTRIIRPSSGHQHRAPRGQRRRRRRRPVLVTSPSAARARASRCVIRAARLADRLDPPQPGLPLALAGLSESPVIPLPGDGPIPPRRSRATVMTYHSDVVRQGAPTTLTGVHDAPCAGQSHPGEQRTTWSRRPSSRACATAAHRTLSIDGGSPRATRRAPDALRARYGGGL